MSEIDIYVKVLNSILTSPHRQLGGLYAIHSDAVDVAPLFYDHLAAWYFDVGEIRDHKVLFVSTLCLSPFPRHRPVGLALLHSLGPRQILQAVEFMSEIKGHKMDGKRFFYTPRSVANEVKRYLKMREDNPGWFYRTMVSHRQTIRDLYQGFHLIPGSLALDRKQKEWYSKALESDQNSALFMGDPPEGTLPWVTKEIARSTDHLETARLIIEHNIPFPVAVSVAGKKAPTIILALVSVMTPQQVINNLGSLKKMGAMDNPEIRPLIQNKIKQGKTDERVAIGKAKVALDATSIDDEEIVESVQEMASSRVKSGERITRPTALFIDASGSMDQAIEIGKRLTSLIMTAMADDVPAYFYAFDSTAYQIVPKGTSLKDAESALVGIRAGGQTSIGAPLASMIKNKIMVEQIVIVTDEGENAFPRFAKVYREYKDAFGIEPSVFSIKVGSRGVSAFEVDVRASEIDYTSFEFTGDYYSLPNVIPLLSRKSMADLVMEILEYPLPERF